MKKFNETKSKKEIQLEEILNNKTLPVEAKNFINFVKKFWNEAASDEYKESTEFFVEEIIPVFEEKNGDYSEISLNFLESNFSVKFMREYRFFVAGLYNILDKLNSEIISIEADIFSIKLAFSEYCDFTKNKKKILMHPDYLNEYLNNRIKLIEDKEKSILCMLELLLKNHAIERKEKTACFEHSKIKSERRMKLLENEFKIKSLDYDKLKLFYVKIIFKLNKNLRKVTEEYKKSNLKIDFNTSKLTELQRLHWEEKLKLNIILILDTSRTFLPGCCSNVITNLETKMLVSKFTNHLHFEKFSWITIFFFLLFSISLTTYQIGKFTYFQGLKLVKETKKYFRKKKLSRSR